MSLYFVKGKGWRYDFTHNGNRYTKSWFTTKKDASKAEAKRKEEIQHPEIHMITEPIPTDIDFLELVNRRLDHLKEYCSKKHYSDHIYYARRWCRFWKNKKCDEITVDMVQSFLLKRKKDVSAITANKELRLLRSLFNFGIRAPRKWISENPTMGIEFFPVDKKEKYVPPMEDVLKVLDVADETTRDYLWTVICTMGRIGEINRLRWTDVNLDARYLVLYTRKKKGGHLTPRRIPLNLTLFNILSERYRKHDKRGPWVFWHRYWSRKTGDWVEGPYMDRQRLMTTLCEEAGVKYFRYHALRHFGASLLDHENAPIGTVQRILGHENRLTTEIYLHSIGEGERTAVGCLDKIFEEFSHTDSHTA
ncbi:MAG: tyrosine-type recombinase/integrase [Pseudomonadota bacterium]